MGAALIKKCDSNVYVNIWVLVTTRKLRPNPENYRDQTIM